MKNLKIIVEKHPDGYVAYPLGVSGTGEANSEQVRYNMNRINGAYL
jgi:hypothetical protein